MNKEEILGKIKSTCPKQEDWYRLETFEEEVDIEKLKKDILSGKIDGCYTGSYANSSSTAELRRFGKIIFSEELLDKLFGEKTIVFRNKDGFIRLYRAYHDSWTLIEHKDYKTMTESEKFIELNKIKPFSFDAKINQEFIATANELFPERKEAIERVYGEFAFAMEGVMQAMYASFASKLRNALGNNKIVFLPEHRPVPSMRNVSKIIVPGNGRKH